MSSIFKVAYARGVQHALVATNAIGKYASEEQADAAAAAAAEEMPPEAAPEGQEMPPSVTGDVAAKLVELSQAAGATAAAAAEQSNVAQEAAQAVQALQQGAGAPAPAAALAPQQDPAALGAAAANLEQKAAALRVMQKRAAMQKNAVGMDLTSQVALGDLEGVTDDLRDPGYAMGAPDYNFSGFSVEEAPHPGAQTAMNAFKQGSVNLDSKTAAAILRKLAVGMDATSPVPVGDIPGLTEDGRPAQFATNSPSTDISGMSAVEGPHPGADTTIDTFKQSSANSAFDMLFRKTAAEVGHYLPQNIPASSKVAAVRTMIGMTPQERGSYLQRLHKAAEDASKEEDGKPSCGNKKCEENGKCSCSSEEKSASAILRRLGVGR